MLSQRSESWTTGHLHELRNLGFATVEFGERRRLFFGMFDFATIRRCCSSGGNGISRLAKLALEISLKVPPEANSSICPRSPITATATYSGKARSRSLTTMFLKPWFVATGICASATRPSVALLDTKMEPGGKSTADEFFSPASVIVRAVRVSFVTRSSAGKSTNVVHACRPFQYSGFSVLGVPPLSSLNNDSSP